MVSLFGVNLRKTLPFGDQCWLIKVRNVKPSFSKTTLKLAFHYGVVPQQFIAIHSRLRLPSAIVQAKEPGG